MYDVFFVTYKIKIQIQISDEFYSSSFLLRTLDIEKYSNPQLKAVFDFMYRSVTLCTLLLSLDY